MLIYAFVFFLDCISNVYIYNKGKESVSLPQNRKLGSADVLSNTIVISGGCSNDSWFSSVYGYNIHSENWFLLQNMIKQRK